jgi:molecular chaperone DnaJ
VPTLTGSGVVRIPPGITSGKKLRLRAKGVPRERGVPGDQLVTVVIESPRVADNTALSEAGRKAVTDALDQLEAVCVAHPRALPRRTAQRDESDQQ